MEEKAADEMEVAAKAHEERAQIEKTAQGDVKRGQFLFVLSDTKN